MCLDIASLEHSLMLCNAFWKILTFLDPDTYLNILYMIKRTVYLIIHTPKEKSRFWIKMRVLH